MTKFIRINRSECNHYESLNENGELLFIDKRSLSIEKVYDYIVVSESKTNEHLIQILLEDKDLLEGYLESQGYENKEELFESKFVEDYSILKHIDETVERKTLFELIEQFCEKNEFSFDTFGYNPWCYGIYSKRLHKGYVNDIYEGYNFYDLELLECDEEGELETVASICGFYLLNDEDLKESIIYTFDVKEEDIVIINDLQGSQDFNNFKKINTIKIVKEFIA